MAYTPELSLHHSRILRRIAWTLGMPMTRAMVEVFDYMGKTLEPAQVCDSCRDRSLCQQCPFSKNRGAAK